MWRYLSENQNLRKNLLSLQLGSNSPEMTEKVFQYIVEFRRLELLMADDINENIDDVKMMNFARKYLKNLIN